MKKKSQLLEELAKQLCDALPDKMQAFKKDLEENFHIALLNTLNKLELVTREEFDAQTKVLARSRKIIENLETRLEKLEKSVKKTVKHDE